MYEDLYTIGPEEDPMCDIDIDILNSEYENKASLCKTNKDALELDALGFSKYLPEHLQYYVYTVKCREENKYPLVIDLWRQL